MAKKYRYNVGLSAEKEITSTIDLTKAEAVINVDNPQEIPNEDLIEGFNNNKTHYINVWTSEEDQIIRDNYPTMGSKVTELLPGRTKDICMSRANRLGIRKCDK